MRDERFKIYVEQLRDGHKESLKESFSPDFLNVHETELAFVDPIKIKGEAYLAEETLILHMDIHTYCMIPCRICNEPVKVELDIKGFYHVVPLEEVKGAIFNFQEILRETILLEVPALAECHQGKCPQREKLKKYLKPETTGTKENKEERYRPFADFDFEEKK